MGEERIDVGIYATDKTSAAAGAATKNLQQVEKTVESTNKSMLNAANASKAMGFVMGGFAATAAWQMASSVAQGTIELAKINVVINRSKSAFTQLSGGAEQAKLKLDAVRRASMGTVNDLDAMQLANKAAALGMAKTAAELEKVVAVATKISMVMGGDVGGILDNLSAAAANLSFVRLDTMGISANATKVKMEELLKVEKDLSKEQAFLQAAVAVANETFKGIGEGADVAIDGAKNLQVAWDNLTMAIAGSALGDAANAALAGLAKGISDATSGQAAIDNIKAVIHQNVLLVEAKREALKAAQDNAYMAEVEAGALAEVDAMSGSAAINARAYAIEKQNEVKALEASISAYDLANQALQRDIIALSGAEIQTAQTSAEVWAGVAAWQTYAVAADNAAGAVRKAGRLRPDLDTRSTSQRIDDTVSGSLKQTRSRTDPIADGMNKFANVMRFTGGVSTLAGKNIEKMATAAGNAVSSLEGAAKKIPGLFGLSSVTETDMAKAKAGMAVNYPDDYVRQAKDEMLNGKDYANIDPAEVAKSLGLDLSVGFDVVIAELERQWASGEYFVNPDNLLKVNWEAYKALMQQEANASLGSENLIAAAMQQGITEESWTAATTGTGPLLVDGVTASLKDTDMNPAAAQFGTKMQSAFGDTASEAGKAAYGAGEALAIAVNAAYNNTAATLPWNVYIPGVSNAAPGTGDSPPTKPPAKAVGTSYWAGGALRVHKDETIILPRGSAVKTSTESQQAGTGAGGNVYVNATVNTPIDVEVLTQQIMRQLRRRAA
jgi:hypothetical protein